jgi:hypothetical protein
LRYMRFVYSWGMIPTMGSKGGSAPPVKKDCFKEWLFQKCCSSLHLYSNRFWYSVIDSVFNLHFRKLDFLCVFYA